MSSWKLVARACPAERPAPRRGARLCAQPPTPLDTIPATGPTGPGRLSYSKYIRKTIAGADARAMFPIHFVD